jgi:hypothetical protein
LDVHACCSLQNVCLYIVRQAGPDTVSAGINRMAQRSRSLTDDLDDYSLLPLSVEFGVEDSLPRPQIKLPFRDG